MVSFPTDFVGMMVPGGCHAQGCHGYLHALLKAHILAASSLRHLLQAHQLVMSLTKHYFYSWCSVRGGWLNSSSFFNLQKYYPPDFDASKIPKLGLSRDRQYVVRLMAPFNMR